MAEFVAAFTDAPREQCQKLAKDEERINYQVTLREQTITNRRTQYQNACPLSNNLMSPILLLQSDLNEQQRERFVSSRKHSTNRHATAHVLAGETVFPRTVLCFQDWSR